MQNKLYLTIFSLWIGHLLVDFTIGMFAVYKTMVHLDLAVAGFIAAACAFAGEGMQALFGSLSDRGYRKHLISLGIMLSATSTLLAYTENYVVLFVLFLLTCIGSGAFHPCAVSVMNDLSQNRKGLLITIFQSGGGIGLAVSQMIFAYTFFMLEGNTVVLAIPSLFLAGALFFSDLFPSNQAHAVAPRKRRMRDFLTFFRNRNLSLLYVSQVCNQALVWSTMFLLPDVLLSRGYDSWICFGGGHLFFIFGASFMMIPGGYLADKYSPKQVIVAAIVLSTLAFYTFLWVPFLSNPALLSLLFVMGTCIGVVNPVSIAFGNRLMPNNSGMVSAFLMGLVWCISEGIGQWGGGLLTKLFVDDAPAKALGCLGVLFFVGLAVCLKLPKEIPAESELELA